MSHKSSASRELTRADLEEIRWGGGPPSPGKGPKRPLSKWDYSLECGAKSWADGAKADIHSLEGSSHRSHLKAEGEKNYQGQARTPSGNSQIKARKQTPTNATSSAKPTCPGFPDGPRMLMIV